MEWRDGERLGPVCFLSKLWKPKYCKMGDGDGGEVLIRGLRLR